MIISYLLVFCFLPLAIEKEQSLVNANKELVAIMEAKIKAKIAEVWGESQEEKPTKTYQLSEEPLAMVAESTE